MNFTSLTRKLSLITALSTVALTATANAAVIYGCEQQPTDNECFRTAWSSISRQTDSQKLTQQVEHAQVPSIDPAEMEALHSLWQSYGLKPYWVPDVVVQLAQVHDVFSRREQFHRYVHGAETVSVFERMHRLTHELLVSVQIHNPGVNSDYTPAIQEIIRRIEHQARSVEHSVEHVDKDQYYGLAKLVAGKDLFAQSVEAERYFWTRGQRILWSFSQGKRQNDGSVTLGGLNSARSEKVDFGYSLLGGYVGDGYTHSDIMQGISNTVACTFCDWDVHRQGINLTQEQNRMITNRAYDPYLASLDIHAVYAIGLDAATIDRLTECSGITLPDRNARTATFGNSFFPAQALYASGEDFHPVIVMNGRTESILRPVFREAYILYGGQRVLANQNDPFALAVRQSYQ